MRKCGVLMHISSLPSPYGIGNFGACAYRFIDFLKDAGQSYWQILPLSPTGYGDSPYQAFSTFAGNHYLIDPDQLIGEGLLKQEEVDSFEWGNDRNRVDFGKLYKNRCNMLRLAYERFVPNEDYERFVEKNASWLYDYALFTVLKGLNGGNPWQQWPEALQKRDPIALEAQYKEHEDDIRFQCFLQYIFFRQWGALHAYAAEKGIRIIGDVPIYVPLDSADCWANPDNFLLDENGRPTAVAGCPPDTFSADGQLWGNPLYNWPKMKENGYSWWIRRLAAASDMYDDVRIDHFRGLESYWSVPAGDKTAAGGAWIKGPGIDFINAIRSALPASSFIAEDLGYMTSEVRQLQEDSGFPCMKVIQFGFDSGEPGEYLPHAYPENSVCYSGTHDNVTLAQWLEEASPAMIAHACAYLGLHSDEGYVHGMIRGCMASYSKLCVIQIQDYLELGASARMNFPGTLSTANWTWRADSGFMTEELAQRMYATAKLYGRL